jgi:molybdopterin-binding protein
MAEVIIRVGDNDVVAEISAGSAKRLKLKKGDKVVAIIKSTEVMIGK